MRDTTHRTQNKTFADTCESRIKPQTVPEPICSEFWLKQHIYIWHHCNIISLYIQQINKHKTIAVRNHFWFINKIYSNWNFLLTLSAILDWSSFNCWHSKCCSTAICCRSLTFLLNKYLFIPYVILWDFCLLFKSLLFPVTSYLSPVLCAWHKKMCS